MESPDANLLHAAREALKWMESADQTLASEFSVGEYEEAAEITALRRALKLADTDEAADDTPQIGYSYGSLPDAATVSEGSVFAKPNEVTKEWELHQKVDGVWHRVTSDR